MKGISRVRNIEKVFNEKLALPVIYLCTNLNYFSPLYRSLSLNLKLKMKQEIQETSFSSFSIAIDLVNWSNKEIHTGLDFYGKIIENEMKLFKLTLQNVPNI